MRGTVVVGLFGGSRHTEVARALGAAVARRGCILLTGGGRGADGPAVTESGLEGAEQVRRDEGAVAARVGVLGRRHPEVGASVEDEGTRIVLGLALGDRRNWVNAHLCDVAVALGGGDGTTSEVAFCLGLGRPVVLVGEEWAARFPLVRARAAYDEFVRAARRRVPAGDRDPVDRMVADTYRRLDRAAPYDVTHVPLAAAPDDVVGRALAAAARVGLQGAFPALPGQRRAVVADTYADWLASTERRLGSGTGAWPSRTTRAISSPRRGSTTRAW